MLGHSDPTFEFQLLGRAASGQASARTRNRWQQEIETAIDARIASTVEQLFLITDPLKVTIIIVSPMRIDLDLDNLAKPILDAMKRKIYADDNLVSTLLVERFHDGEESRQELINGVFAEGLEQLEIGDMTSQMLYIRLDARVSTRRHM